MNRLQWSPSVVVGVDFGMTCTGVAYSSEESDWGEPQILQNWPGHSRLANKCPTQVAYDSAGRLVDWGYCNRAQNIATLVQYFKLALDPSFREPTIPHNDATRYYIDYMSELNKHINGMLAQLFPSWHSRRVEYRFSIPTNWTSPRLTFQLKRCLLQAGFVSKGNRRIVFTRTEAEAAAVYAADFVHTGDTLMVVDAGGATTDITLLRVTQKSDRVNQMAALDKTEGMNVGSVQIDQAACELIMRKIERMSVPSGGGGRQLAALMMEISLFSLWKSDYGNPSGRDVLYLGIPPDNRQHICLTSLELKQIFDDVIKELISFVKYKLESFENSHPEQHIRYIVLSGGLGSSTYLKDQLDTEINTNCRHSSNFQNIQILRTADPQVAVVKGLVRDRPSSEYPLPSSFVDRRARASYGLLTKTPYISKLHFEIPATQDIFTGKLFVEQQIDWIIKEGEILSEDGYKKEYSLRLSKDREVESLQCAVVTSDLPVSRLPVSVRRGSVTTLCNVYGMFEPGDFDTGKSQKSKGRLFSRAKDHDIATVYLKIMVRSTDFTFEFETLNGRKYSEESSSVKVVWGEGDTLIQAY